MNFINELKAKSNGVAQKKNEVIAEILAYFDEKLTKDNMEEFLRTFIDKRDLEEREITLYVEFWEYHDGCSSTRIRCGGFVWNNPENNSGYESREYKNVKLFSISDEICRKLSLKLMRLMEDIGFITKRREMKPSRFNYYEEKFIFEW